MALSDDQHIASERYGNALSAMAVGLMAIVAWFLIVAGLAPLALLCGLASVIVGATQTLRWVTIQQRFVQPEPEILGLAPIRFTSEMIETRQDTPHVQQQQQ